MNNFLNPSSVVIVALVLSAAMTFATEGKVNWEKLAINSVTFYFVCMRGKQDEPKQ